MIKAEEYLTTILQHKIGWWIGEDDSIKELDESDIEHIKQAIIDGYNQGELIHGEDGIRGWWHII